MSGFWGLVVKPGSKPTPMRATPGEMVMVLKQAALAPNGKLGSETSVLSVSVGPDTNERFVLCHLTPGKCEQWAIDLGFGPDEEVHFHLTGKCPVHLTGFYELDDDDEDDDEDSDEALARYEGEGMYDDEDDEDDSEEDGEDGEADGMDEEIDSDDVEEDDDEDEGDQDGPRIIELDANGQPVEVEDDSEEDEEDEDNDDDDEEEDDEDDDEDDEDDEQEFTAEELKKKRDELFKGLNPSDLASDDDDDDLDDEDDEMEGEEDEEDESDEEDDDEGEEDEDEDEEGEEDESEEEDSPPPQSKKRSSMASTTAATPSKKMKGTPDAKAGAGTPGVGWTAAEEAKLKKAAGATDANTPNRWAKVATAVGSGKSKDACKKHYKELGGK